MNHEQWKEFEYVAHLCYHAEFRSINVASKRRIDAIWGAYTEVLRLRKALQEIVGASQNYVRPDDAADEMAAIARNVLGDNA